MSTSINNTNSTKVVSGLNTFVYTLNSTSEHIVSCRCTIPLNSGVTVAIKQNASTIATSTAPTPDQREINISASLAITSGDTVSFVIASSSLVDQLPNVVKSILNVHIGVV